MKGQDKYNNHNPGDVTRRNSWDDPGFEMLLSPEDSALFGKISEDMKGLSDIEDVNNDPMYPVMDNEVKEMISGYRKNITLNKDIEKFIRDSFAEETPEEKLRNDISQIKNEISKTSLNDISSEWVKEWKENKQKNSSNDAKVQEIRDFITGSFEEEEIIAEKRSDDGNNGGLSKSRITRYISLAAAAIIGAVFLVRSLIPSDDPQKIFSKYYEPFSAVSAVTRSKATSGSESFIRAVENYKSGDYQAAANGLSEAILNGTKTFSASFFLGITEIELEDYDRAIDLLGGVANQQGEYAKEATWYLGLAYCKAGNEVKAIECFELLARSPGFYSDRSEKILRRLK